MLKVTVKRDRIQFESMESCACGNSHRDKAADAWRFEVERQLETAGFEAQAAAEHGRDSGKFAIYIEEHQDQDGEPGRCWHAGNLSKAPHCTTKGHYQDAPTAEVIAAHKAAEAADMAGKDAAMDAYRADCSELSEAKE